MLREKLKLRIKEDKNISFSEYMEIILFDKDYGLYEKGQVLGQEGHFITSPLVSKHFSHCIAKNFIRVFKLLYIIDMHWVTSKKIFFLLIAIIHFFYMPHWNNLI